MNKYFIAVDIGATKTRVAIGDTNGLIDKKVFLTPKTGNSLIIARKIYECIINSYGSFIDKVESIGIGTIGPLDIRMGKVVNPTNLNIESVELKTPLEEWLKKPVYVLNDAMAGVLGEKMFGLGKDYSNIVYITISTGVGGGIIVDDHLLIGKLGNAHEIGHIVVDYDSDIPCGCGGYGHWESFAGGANIPRLAMILARRNPGMFKTKCYEESMKGEITPPRLFQCYRENDMFAKYVVEKIVKASGAGLANVINSYDPEIITIGGSVYLNNIDILREPMIRYAKKNAVTEMPRIETTPLGEDIVLYGALAVAIKPPAELLRIQKTTI
ncbi:MAG: ROK family protein [Staphylothermus sp.]|nr:ROK family protein [Staphylothermus sp.]